MISNDALHLLPGIFFSSQQDYKFALHEISWSAQAPINGLAIIILEIMKKSLGNFNLADQEKNIITQTECLLISSLPNGDEILTE